MKKWRIYNLVLILILTTLHKANAQELSLLKTRHLPYYPSASSLELYKNHLYVIGDDAPHILILDTSYTIKDSISLFTAKAKRIAPDKKADLESSFLHHHNNKDYLVIFSSFATKKRNKTIVYNLTDAKKKKVFSNSLKEKSVKELNIEGAVLIDQTLVLSNRANNQNKENSLLLKKFSFKKGIIDNDSKLISLKLPVNKQVMGTSGLTYWKEKDLLLFTASIENTGNAYSDGAIGESYLGYIKNISSRLHEKELSPDGYMALSPHLKSHTPQKIESIAVQKNIGNNLIIHLAADNDNGESTLFQLRLNVN